MLRTPIAGCYVEAIKESVVSNQVQINVRVPEEMHVAVKAWCAAAGVTVQDLVTSLLADVVLREPENYKRARVLAAALKKVRQEAARKVLFEADQDTPETVADEYRKRFLGK